MREFILRERNQVLEPHQRRVPHLLTFGGTHKLTYVARESSLEFTRIYPLYQRPRSWRDDSIQVLTGDLVYIFNFCINEWLISKTHRRCFACRR